MSQDPINRLRPTACPRARSFTDTRLDEQQRCISIKAVPMSLVMEGTSGKSYLLNLMDTPGES